MNVFSYFRMGLVTGLVDKQTLIAWADSEIMRQPIPQPEIMELSLSMNRPYSEIIWLLSSYEYKADYDLPLKLLFARAGMLLDQDASRAPEIVMGLRLLNEEEHLDKGLRVQLSDLDRCREMTSRGEIAKDDLVERLSRFLADYAAYADDVQQLEKRVL
ncbi:MAG: hypothetical protein JXA89_06840 [Anaerolineae bacterium]|nr:hypothetical protein [Anaerolineae bacterium]